MVVTPKRSYLHDAAEHFDCVDHLQIGKASGDLIGFTIQFNNGNKSCLALDPTAARQLGEGLVIFAGLAEDRAH